MTYIEWIQQQDADIELIFQAAELCETTPQGASKWSFGKVREVQILFAKEATHQTVIDIVKMTSKLTEYSDVSIVLKQFFSVKKEIDQITINERNTLSHMPSAKEYAASMSVGGFERFGYMPEVDSLAQGDVRRYDEIEALPYEVCFAKLLYSKVCKDYEREINKFEQ